MAEPLTAVQLAELMARASWTGATLSWGAPRSLLSVRARGAACARVAAALGGPALPGANAVADTTHGHALWLRPDEWLVTAPAEERLALIARLENAIDPADGAVVDVSASRAVLQLAGPATRDVLAGCLPIDLHPRAVGPGRCAQTLVAKAPVLLHLLDDAPTWHVYARPSLLDYVVRWLADGMEGVRAEERAAATPRA